jgi:hypothetical protein
MSGANRITAALVLIAVTAAACAVEAAPPKGTCSPGYEERSGLGSFSARQPGPGAPIDWGLYPDYPAIRFDLQVHVGSRLVDERKQTTPPRGTVRAADVAGKSGQDLTVAGRLLDG